MNLSKIKYQLQEASEKIFDSKLIIVEINALPKEWDGFTSNIYARKESISYEVTGLMFNRRIYNKGYK